MMIQALIALLNIPEFPARQLKIFLISLCLCLFTACDNNNQPAIQSSHPISPVHRVEVTRVAIESLSIDKTVSGNLEAVNKQRVYNEESARIISLPFHEGDTVKRGDILVKLDASLIKTELEKARASYNQANADLKRLQKLLPKNISTQEEVALAKTELELAKADVDFQRTRLARTTIKANINGVVSERLFEPGDFLGIQSHILTIIDPNRLRTRVQLSERLLPMVKQNQTVNVTIDALGSAKWPGKVSRIFPVVDQDTHKGTIEVELSPVPAGALAGQFVRINFHLKLDRKLVVPTRSIQLEPAGAYVFRVTNPQIIEQPAGSHINKKNTQVEKVYFEKGSQFSDKTVINSGLTAGDYIVTRGFLGLRAGKTVEIARLYKGSASTKAEME